MRTFNQELKKYGNEHNIPITLDETLDALIDLINQSGSRRVLEIGTAIGYGTTSIAEYSCADSIDSLEIDTPTYELAKANVAKSKAKDKITLFNIDAMQYLKSCTKKYDFIYLDGAKGQYINYLPYMLKILDIGGIIFADNLYFHGMVTGKIPISKGCRAMIKGLKKYIKEIQSNPSLSTQILDMGDGIGISKKIK